MNLIRSVMSVFLLIVLGLAVAGWVWAGEQPTTYVSTGGRVAVSLCGLAAVGALGLIWSAKRPVTR
jgi:hypothetical protein